MELFSLEEQLVSSNNDQIILTTHRLQKNSEDWGSSYQNTLFLEDISSIEVRYTSLVIALMLGIVLIIGGVLWASQQEVSPFNWATGIGALAIFVWFLSRQHMVSITPNGGKSLNFAINKMSAEEVADFIHKVQLAKLARKEGK